MQTPTALDPPNGVYHLTRNFAISRLFIETKSRIFINFTIITYKLKFKFSLLTLSLSYTCWNAKGVSSYFGACVL